MVAAELVAYVVTLKRDGGWAQGSGGGGAGWTDFEGGSGACWLMEETELRWN